MSRAKFIFKDSLGKRRFEIK